MCSCVHKFEVWCPQLLSHRSSQEHFLQGVRCESFSRQDHTNPLIIYYKSIQNQLLVCHPENITDIFHCVQLTCLNLLLWFSFMAVGIHKCCISAIYWSVPLPSIPALPWCVLNYPSFPSNLLGTMCERGD